MERVLAITKSKGIEKTEGDSCINNPKDCISDIVEWNGVSSVQLGDDNKNDKRNAKSKLLMGLSYKKYRIKGMITLNTSKSPVIAWGFTSPAFTSL